MHNAGPDIQERGRELRNDEMTVAYDHTGVAFQHCIDLHDDSVRVIGTRVLTDGRLKVSRT